MCMLGINDGSINEASLANIPWPVCNVKLVSCIGKYIYYCDLY